MEDKKGLVFAIVGVFTLVIAVIGSTYAFYAASVNNTTKVTGTAGGGAAPTLTIDKMTSDGTGVTGYKGSSLIPITEGSGATTGSMLNSAASATNKCIDNNGYTACDVYSVVVKNNADVKTTFDITLNIPAVSSMPYLSAVQMTSATAVSINSSNALNRIGSAADGTVRAISGAICTTSEISKNGTGTCYFMVYIKEKGSAQTDNGTYSGTVTATSTTGSQISAQF